MKQVIKHINKQIVTTATILLVAITGVEAQQQMENSMSQYFRNKMLWNAGYTGAAGNRLYALQNRSWAGFDGAPVMTSLSGEFSFGKNSAGGVQVISDVAGVMYRTYGVFNYAYRIKLGEDQSLRLGVALAFTSDRLNSKALEGTTPDPTILNNINSNAKFDGNFGAVYQKGALDIGLSLYRLGANMRNTGTNNINQAVGQLGVGYKLKLTADEKVLLRPLAMFRLYRETKSVLDIGAELDYHELLHVMAVYQSTGNIRAGAGLRKAGLGEANFFYNTNTKVANSASQQYELGIALYLKGKN